MVLIAAASADAGFKGRIPEELQKLLEKDTSSQASDSSRDRDEAGSLLDVELASPGTEDAPGGTSAGVAGGIQVQPLPPPGELSPFWCTIGIMLSLMVYGVLQVRFHHTLCYR